MGNIAEREKADTANGLEALAADSGLLSESEGQAPPGSYGRSYEGGEDRLCIRADPGSDDRYRVGVEIRIGQEEYCRGGGTARRAGGLLIVSLDKAACTITARFEGDRIVMPGAVDRACASLCSARGSLAGVTFPRIVSGEAAAMAVKGEDGHPLCQEKDAKSSL